MVFLSLDIISSFKIVQTLISVSVQLNNCQLLHGSSNQYIVSVSLCIYAVSVFCCAIVHFAYFTTSVCNSTRIISYI